MELQTPVFMPVWTKATIKWIMLELLKDPKTLGTSQDIRLILANTYHLFLNPWDELIKSAWGLHKFENRDKLILTDSWGFQVFSLWKWGLSKVQKDWVWFKSPYDWKKHFFSPEWTVDIQSNFWSDIMMVLDVCSDLSNASKRKVANDMTQTHNWAKRQFDYMWDIYDKVRWVLFPIVQGWIYEDLREESAKTLSQYAWDWIAIGWLSVWEAKPEMEATLEKLETHLPFDRPRYLMWIWTPDYIRSAVERWIDMFDCVLPTRLGRHWAVFSSEWNLKIWNSRFKTDFWPLDPKCKCHTCQNFSRAYLHHLFKQWEMLSSILLSLHNISFLHNLVEEIREDILNS